MGWLSAGVKASKTRGLFSVGWVGFYVRISRAETLGYLEA
jgi:hypothetical protein